MPFQATATTRFCDYQITGIGDMLTLGVYRHENGHMVRSFPDLYDYGGESAGVGGYCLMCQDGSTNPVQVCAFLKNKAGWADDLTDLMPGNEYLPDAGLLIWHVDEADSNNVYAFAVDSGLYVYGLEPEVPCA